MGLALYLSARLQGDDRSVFVPAATTSGHHQIELACEACHVGAFSGADAMQNACEGCHLEALDEARDAHPKAKFTDPRNADRTAKLDARYCMTCHAEHKPSATHAMGLTVPEDYCVLCHDQIADERPSHAGMAFDTCAASGCHNFHDNRALYEDFLLKHLDEPPLLEDPVLPERNFADIAAYLEHYPKERYPVSPLTPAEHDAPPGTDLADTALLDDWATTAHAGGGVNCSACHLKPDSGAWLDKPGYERCADCHASESAAFVSGLHGMRLDEARLGRALAPMRVRDARLPMRTDAAGATVTCGSCHGAHRFDTRRAAVEACLGCHDDTHSRAYVDSPHDRLRRLELAGRLPPGSGVTCASCHMPRVPESYEWGAYIHTLVQHNQSDNLRPNDKMLRPVCMQCHGYGFSADALADPDLILGNFDGPPSVVVESRSLAERRRLEIERQREAERRATTQR